VNGISAYDASLALQHDAGLLTLSGYQATAADVNKSGAITSMDAFYILQKAVDLIALPFPGAGVVWEFAPSSRSYPNLNSNQTGQDFTAILLGDVSGNWSAGGAYLSTAQPAGNPVQLTAVIGSPDLAGVVTVTVSVDPAGTPVHSLELDLSHAPAATPLRVEPAPTAGDVAAIANLGTPGRVRIALAGARPIAAPGDLLRLTFQLPDPAAPVELALARGVVNEGGVPLAWESTPAGSRRIFLPLMNQAGGG
jgi:hypothetical protein